ncbi:MAG: PAS domain S-box protein [Chitinophagaceae bacterium]|nr:PAS domain S-box protein [Chitinophagaceae bacterium]
MILPEWQSNILADSNVFLYIVFDPAGKIVFSNRCFTSLVLARDSTEYSLYKFVSIPDHLKISKLLFQSNEKELRAERICFDVKGYDELVGTQWEFTSHKHEENIYIEAVGTAINITAQPSQGPLRSFENLIDKKTKDPYKFLFYKNPVPMWIYDVATLLFLEVNETAIHNYGYSKKEFLTMTLRDIRPPSEVTRLMEKQQSQYIQNAINKGIWKHVKKNGDVIDVHITAHLLDLGGRQAKLVLAEDITEKIKTEESLIRSNERYNYASKATFDAIWDWDFTTNKMYWGEGFKMLFGYDIPSKNADISSWSDHIHPDEKERVQASMLRAINNGANSWTDEYKYIKADGTLAYVIDRGIIIRDHEGKATRMIGAMQDITIRKSNEQQLQKINLQLLRQQKERELTASILRSLSEKELLNDALEDILRKLTIFFNFEIGEIWFLNLDKKRLELRQKWYASKYVELFYKIHSDVTYKFKEAGILGKSWNENEIIFINDLQNYESFQRKQGAIDAGLTKSLGVPIIFKGETIALFSFFGKKEIVEKEKVKLYFESLSLQLGINIQRKKTEEELNQFFYLSPDILAIIGFDGYFKKINPAFTNILGYDKVTLEKLKLNDLMHPDDVGITNERLIELKKGKTVHFENRLLSKDETYKWLSWATAPLVEEELIYATAKDVTDKKNLDEKLNRILESISDGFLTVDKDFTILYWNLQAEKLLRVKREDVIGKKIYTVFQGKVPDNFFNEYIEAFKNNTPVHFEEFVPRYNTWFEVNAYPYEGILSVFFKDVTERKKSEEVVRISSERYEVLAKATKDAIYDWNLVTNRVTWNEGIKTIFNDTDLKEYNDTRWWNEKIHPDDRTRVLDKINNHIKSHQSNWEEEYRFRCKNGNYKYIYDRGFTIYNNEDQPIRMIGSMQDLTETKSNELILKELNESLEKRASQLATSNAELESFAYVASHDLQEPLRMVSSFLQLIERRYKDKLDQKAHEYIRFAVDGAERMKGLILDLLEYSRVNSRKEQKEMVDLNEVASNLKITYKEVVETAEGILDLGELPMVLGNKIQLMQLFQNLVSNALKYKSNQPPVIKITVEQIEDYYKFAVKDNGIGIEERFFNKIFTIFQRLHNKNEYSGTGIGLAICKKIIEIHAGNIWVESTPGHGSTFYFTLPFNTSTEAEIINDGMTK